MKTSRKELILDAMKSFIDEHYGRNEAADPCYDLEGMADEIETFIGKPTIIEDYKNALPYEDFEDMSENDIIYSIIESVKLGYCDTEPFGHLIWLDK